MRTIARAIAVLECFTTDSPVLPLRDIAKHVGLAKSTTSRIIRSLEELGYLVRLEGEQFCLSPRLLRLSSAVQKTPDVRTITRPEMERLASRLHETVTLSTIMDRERFRIDVISMLPSVLSVMGPGEHAPLNISASSLTLLAFANEEKKQAILPAVLRFNHLKKQQLTDMLAGVHRQGFAVSHSLSTRGLSAIAIPVQGMTNDANYCIAVAGPTTRFSQRLPEIKRYALEAANRISLRLGAGAAQLPNG